MPQFNGKQEAAAPRAKANLRCPRNGKRPDCTLLASQSRFALDSHWVRDATSAPGKAAKRTR